MSARIRSARIRIVLATHNAHKVGEFQRILGAALPELEIVAYDGPEPVEDGVSFAENALIKAHAAALYTGLPAMADDSGICVDVLGGAPGIFSARWSGAHGDSAANLNLLLDQLGDVRESDRGAHFTATIALAVPQVDSKTTGTTTVDTVVEGIWPGRVAQQADGDHGFGYDPIFVPDGGSTTAARLSAEAKNSQSHRARAFEKIVPALRSLVSAE